MAKTIGEVLKEERVMAGLSQSDLADAIHVSRQAISRWENGKNVPDLENIQLLSEFFGRQILPLDDLGNVEVREYKKENNENAKDNKSKELTMFLGLGSFLNIGFLMPILGVFISIIVIIYNRQNEVMKKVVLLLCLLCIAKSFIHICHTLQAVVEMNEQNDPLLRLLSFPQ